MNRVVVYFVLPFVVAAASVINVIVFWISNLLREDWAPIVKLSMVASIVVILVAAGAAFSVVGRGKAMRRTVLAIALVVMAAVGFVPRLLDFLDQQQRQGEQQAANADAEMQFQSDFLDRSDEVDDRIAQKRPFTTDEALAFLEFAAGADLTWRGLPDHTPEAFTLVKQSLDAGILDPNALTTNAPVAVSPTVTLTLAYYDKAIRPTMPRSVERHAWEIVKLLVDHGADISSPDAAQLREYIARTPVGEGRFIRFE
jgi:type II secretory pathway pseudopilin PulG